MTKRTIKTYLLVGILGLIILTKFIVLLSNILEVRTMMGRIALHLEIANYTELIVLSFGIAGLFIRNRIGVGLILLYPFVSVLHVFVFRILTTSFSELNSLILLLIPSLILLLTIAIVRLDYFKEYRFRRYKNDVWVVGFMSIIVSLIMNYTYII
ncbi:hypothetical protein [Carboxylicivirga marina]|uniref:DoxX family protein n=1 Tax=Carboxylicivirga marina TaxID=2800988 RepID=A0ABS1HPK3_9BACT|nr:hypothetical protein [Carboxylicivirga marina]MBK3519618.1 hypothetical protein [Carboxylicivirga marina]